MRKNFPVLAFFLFCLGCGGYSPEIYPQKERQIHVSVYEQGQVISGFNLSGTAEEIAAISRILYEKNRTWKPSLASYAPTFHLEGSSWSITVLPELLVVNSAPSRQTVSPLSPEQFKAITASLTANHR